MQLRHHHELFSPSFAVHVVDERNQVVDRAGFLMCIRCVINFHLLFSLLGYIQKERESAREEDRETIDEEAELND